MPECIVDTREVDKAFGIIARLPLELVKTIRNLVDDIGLGIQAQSMKQAPIDEGPLRQSAQTETVAQPDGIASVVSYGGFAEPYAEIQHSREDYIHPKGGQDHFLYGRPSSPWNDEAERRVMGRLQTQIFEHATGVLGL